MRRLPDPDFFVPVPLRRKRAEEEVRRAVELARDVLVVTHRDCLDGIGSYLVHALAQETAPPYLLAHPSDIHDVLARIATWPGAGRTVSVNDLSFQRESWGKVVAALGSLRQAGWRVVWRDHHHTQWEGMDLARFEALVDRFVLDRAAAECGTSLAQRDLLPDDPLARELAVIIRDRDLWRNQDERGARYEAAARKLGTAAFIERFLAVRDTDAAWIRAAADDAKRSDDADVEAAILAAEVFGARSEVGVIYGEVPKNVTMQRLRERRGTRIEINLKPDGTFSVRSAPDVPIAHLVGQAYGGGGHPNAAGGQARVAPWEWPAYWLSGGLSPAGKSVVRTALRLLAEHDGAGKKR